MTRDKLFSTKINSIEVKFSLSDFVPILNIDPIDDPKFITIRKEDKEYLTEIHFIIPTQDSCVILLIIRIALHDRYSCKNR